METRMETSIKINDEQVKEKCVNEKHVKDEGIQTEASSNQQCSLCVISSMLLCIGIGIMCIMIALDKNEPSETHMIHLEGEIVYVFYLGVMILFCIGICLCGAMCGHLCSDLCLFSAN